MAWGYPDPGHHAPRETTQPREASSGGKWEGWLWRCPVPLLLGCSRSQRGQDPPALPAAPPKCCLDGLPAEQTQPSPRRGAPSTKAAPLSSKCPQRGRKLPVCTGLVWDPSLAQLRGCADPWGSGDPLWLLQDRPGFGRAGDGCGRSKSWDPGSARHPLSAEGGKGGTLQPWGYKMPPHPLTEPPPVSEPPSPHKGLIWLQDWTHPLNPSPRVPPCQAQASPSPSRGMEGEGR